MGIVSDENLVDMLAELRARQEGLLEMQAQQMQISTITQRPVMDMTDYGAQQQEIYRKTRLAQKEAEWREARMHPSIPPAPDGVGWHWNTQIKRWERKLSNNDRKRLRQWEASKRAGRAAREAAREDGMQTAPEPGINGWGALSVCTTAVALTATLFLGLPLWICAVAIVVCWLIEYLANLTDQVLSETVPSSEVEQRKLDWILGPELPALPPPYVEPEPTDYSYTRANCPGEVLVMGDPLQRCQMCGVRHVDAS